MDQIGVDWEQRKKKKQEEYIKKQQNREFHAVKKQKEKTSGEGELSKWRREKIQNLISFIVLLSFYCIGATLSFFFYPLRSLRPLVVVDVKQIYWDIMTCKKLYVFNIYSLMSLGIKCTSVKPSPPWWPRTYPSPPKVSSGPLYYCYCYYVCVCVCLVRIVNIRVTTLANFKYAIQYC